MDSSNVDQSDVAMEESNLENHLPKCTFNEYMANQQSYDRIINGLENWTCVPEINITPLHQIKDNTLVVYTGMVQDMLDPEFITFRNEMKNTVLLSELKLNASDLQEDEDDQFEYLEERKPIFCIPIPGLNTWAKQRNVEKVEEDNKSLESPQVAKRKHSIDESEEEIPKRRLNEPLEESSRVSDVLTSSNDRYFPFPESDFPSIVTIARDCEVLLNERIQVLGFIALKPNFDGEYPQPASLVPRIHAIKVRKMKHCNPLLPQIIPPIVQSEVDELRQDLVMTLTQLLFGDSLAAEYLLCSLIASVYVRRDCLTLGAFSLNLHNVRQRDYAKKLFSFLQNLIPASIYLPLTIESLNKDPFVPKKDYDTNRLVSGRLQLSDDTHLLVDETKMQDGRLDDLGCRNIAALRCLVLRQQLQYDFKYYQIDYNTSVPVVVISEGKSMIPVDISLKLNPESDLLLSIDNIFEAASIFLSGNRLERIRNYLSDVRLRECNLDEDIAAKIETDWVEMRQSNNKLMQEDLHRHIVLARLLSLSAGCTSVSGEFWSKIREMERSRLSRFV